MRRNDFLVGGAKTGEKEDHQIQNITVFYIFRNGICSLSVGSGTKAAKPP